MYKTSILIICILFVLCVNCSKNDENIQPDDEVQLPFSSLQYGINIDVQSISEEDLAEIAQMGFDYVRLDMWWDHIETSQGTYNFESYDALMDALQKYNLKAVIILCYGNTIYEPDILRISTNNGREAFSKYAIACTERYQNANAIWEVWNEPDGEAFWHGTTEEYMLLLKETYRCIKKNYRDLPIAGPAVIGMTDNEWKEYFNRGLVENVDVVSVHLYREVVPETAINLDIDPIRKLIRSYSDKNLPLICSEWGYSRNEILTESQQAALQERIFLTNTLAKTPLTILYKWKNASKEDELIDNFGLLDASGEKTESYYAIAGFLEKIKNASLVKTIASNENEEIHIFEKQGKYFLVFWDTQFPFTSYNKTLNNNRLITVSHKPSYIEIFETEVKDLQN